MFCWDVFIRYGGTCMVFLSSMLHTSSAVWSDSSWSLCQTGQWWGDGRLESWLLPAWSAALPGEWSWACSVVKSVRPLLLPPYLSPVTLMSASVLLQPTPLKLSFWPWLSCTVWLAGWNENISFIVRSFDLKWSMIFVEGISQVGNSKLPKLNSNLL